MTWETVIGLETHVELSTKTKIFCSCTTEFGGAPNTHCCPVCMGMPGTLPVVNEKVLEYAVKVGLALDGEITRSCRFDRKNYFYPDLPKAYQISQLYLPIVRNGKLTIHTEAGGEKTIRIHELHMEEDAGKLVHDPWIDQTRCDYNRCGVPLIEIVTEPDFRSGAEVIAYLEKLRSTLQYLGVSDCKMQEGSLRCDVNLSVRPAGSTELGTRTEMKNLNSFKAIARSIEYEARRQIELLEEGKRVIQETRRWDENKDATFAMRSKENAQDYRYFPEPDIPPLEIGEDYLERLREAQPEMAEAKMARYQSDWGLPAYDAQMLTGQKALADFFEETVALGAPAKQAANWIMGEVMRRLSADGLEAKDMTFTPKTLARLIESVQTGALNRNTAVKVFDAVFADDADVDAYVKAHGLEQVSDAGLVAGVVDKVLAANPKSIQDFKAGKEKAFGFLVGQVMRELKGQASPQVVNQTIREKLE
ncbi:Asp-tRNA(Asn)/Glu-tRNA(Gln) amidotransferase subunit GatB [Intestinimonas butyriciproducens]|uniref:Asp-tRNA(Asn)/Glu-tRNA(Gln) amidotransferase subunit GatB n=1 Tax=Intestinimonas butyriciproducens TaxID=1297617 RepID=UPI00195A88E4|nr:Asp-tRNA(Asn)/Glu-tRNA(Gln) amidotransferase subunit GatB [Intestinimonas butyriciproducens]MBM6976051.1 Asp-tRNA(Asn)/Glu-tRNA(Gln) amidotransferase subunit GatB [Intestinimonas butyriciproducens]